MIDKKYISGLSLPTAIILSLAGMGIVFSYYNTLFNEHWAVEYEIAETKALYMADTGIAHSLKYMIDKDFNIYCDAEVGETKEELNGEISSMDQTGRKMGNYNVTYCLDPATYSPIAESIGKSTVKNVYGKSIEITKKRTIKFGAGEALNDYLYLTNSERAGGAPFVFDGFPSPNNRREVNFGNSDGFNSGWPLGEPVCDVGFQTNGQFVMSDFGCPTFQTTVTVTENSEGEVNFPDMGACNVNQVFQGEPPLDTLQQICLNSSDDFADKREFVESHPNSHLFIDATHKNRTHPDGPQNGLRDTLIWTDIQFFDTGNVRVKQWWYLMPPYFECENNDGVDIDGDGQGDGNGTCDNAFNPNVVPYYFMNQGMMYDFDGDQCAEPQVRDCEKYEDSLEKFHAKTNSFANNDQFLDPIVQGTYGFHHYQVQDLNKSEGNNWKPQFGPYGAVADYGRWRNLLKGPSGGATDGNVDYQLDGYKDYYFNRPTAIYVKGGPVSVHGEFSGRYTIMTDEHVVYRRHATQNAISQEYDTLWTNIWITDDLTNADATGWNNTLINAQPDENCDGGSENILGLVSGANVYVANTRANGARNGLYGDDIHIHAHIIAFNESFSVQYWQNTISNPAYCSDPPYGDGQGENIYNGGTGGNDDRGNIYLWGGVVQKYRGYTVRNNPGPYPTGPIGFGKSYNFDCNLKCSDPPPLYPDKRQGSCEEDTFEKSYSIANYY